MCVDICYLHISKGRLSNRKMKIARLIRMAVRCCQAQALRQPLVAAYRCHSVKRIFLRSTEPGVLYRDTHPLCLRLYFLLKYIAFGET